MYAIVHIPKTQEFAITLQACRKQGRGPGRGFSPPPVFGQTEGQIIPNIVLQATPRIFRRCDGPVINHITSNLMKFHGYDRSSALVLDIFYETHFLAYCPWSLKVRGHKSLSRRRFCLLRSLTNT